MRAVAAMEKLPEMEAPEIQATEGRALAGKDGGLHAAGGQRDDLQMLVCELLAENQRLRMRMAQLEQQAERAERGLASATRGAGAFF